MKYFYLIFCIIFGIQIDNPALSQDSRLDTSNDTTDNYIPTDYQSVTRGRALFIDHCSYCHAITHEIIGPALAGVHNKRPVSWLYRFITNSQQVIKGGDEYANFLYQSFDQYLMPPFTFLSMDEVTDILAYIKDNSTAERPVAGAVSGSQETKNNEIPAIAQKDILGELKYKHPSDEGAFQGFFSFLMIAVVVVTLAIMALLTIVFFKSLNPLKSKK